MKINRLEWFVQQALPAVYDDSLSFYELLSKVLAKLNEVIDDVNAYFGEDIVEHVKTILNEWYENGKLADIISDVFDMKANTEDMNKIAVVFRGTTATELQLLLDIAKTNPNGLTIKVPAGTIIIDSVLRIYKNTHLMMDPQTILLRSHNGGFFINGDIGATYTGYDGQGHITIEGGTLDGNANVFTQGFNAFGLARCQDVTLKDIVFKDVIGGHAVDMSSSKDVKILHCSFIGYRPNVGDTVYREAIQIGEHTYDGFSEFGSYDGATCENITVKRCYFGPSGTGNTQSYSVAIGHHSAVHNKYHKNLKIKENTFDGIVYAAIHLFKHNDTIIEDNHFYGCFRGVFVSTPYTNSYSTQDENKVQRTTPQALSNLFIVNNLFVNLGYTAIEITGHGSAGYYAKVKNVQIKNNILDNSVPSQFSFIQLDWVDRALIEGNLGENATRAVAITYSNDVVFSKNRFINSLWEGIYVSEEEGEFQNTGLTYNIEILQNYLKTTQYNGILFQYVKGFKINENVIESPALETDNLRNGIMLSNSDRGFVSGNRVRKATSGNQNKYGIEVTGTTTNVQVFNNSVEGKTKPLSLAATAGVFEGAIFHNSTGSQKYKVSLDAAGAIVTTLI
jgi:DNA-binding winged helix-turn-helix (wHTH) protein